MNETTNTTALVIRNWRRFQHYRDRNPPWIKLHWELLSSEDWVELNDASRVLAVACMLIASRNDGRVPLSPEYVRRVAYLNSAPDFAPLIKCGFLREVAEDDDHASKPLAGATPETEKEEEKNAHSAHARKGQKNTPGKEPKAQGNVWPTPEQVLAYAVSPHCGYQGFDAEASQYFLDCLRKNGKPVVDWRADLRTWKVRDGGKWIPFSQRKKPGATGTERSLAPGQVHRQNDPLIYQEGKL